MFSKKLISVILAITCVLGAFCFTAGAETEDTNYNADLEIMTDSYLFLAYFMDGWFAEGESPSADVIDQFFKWDVETGFEDYCVGEDDNMFLIYEIPAELYEEMVFSVLLKTDAIVNELHASDIYKTDRDEPYYRITIGGGFGDYLPSYVHQGYVEENGVLTAWGYLAAAYVEAYDEEAGYWDLLPYVPEEGAVEGVDYIYIANENFEYDEETDTYTDTFSYVPAKIEGVLKSSYVLDESGEYLLYRSYEKVGTELMPSEDDMKLPEDDTYYAYLGGTVMEIEDGMFDIGTVVYGENITEGETFDGVVTALADVSGDVVGVYDFYAVKDGENVQPGKPITVTFDIPAGYSVADAALYYVADDGSVEEIGIVETDDFFMTVTAVLDHFSHYALVAEPIVYGDANGDGKVGLTDASLLLQSIAGWEVDIKDYATDVNADEKTNLSDVTVLLQYIAGWDVVLGPGYGAVDWAPVYKAELLDYVTGDGGYITKEGGFALAYIDGDDIPELVLADENGDFVIYTVDENEEIAEFSILNGEETPVKFSINSFAYLEGLSNFIITSQDGNTISVYSDGTGYGVDMIIASDISDKDGKYFVKEYDPEQVISGGSEYIASVEQVELSDEEAEIVVGLLSEMIANGAYTAFDPETLFELSADSINEVFA